jgi:hypothetical protein
MIFCPDAAYNNKQLDFPTTFCHKSSEIINEVAHLTHPNENQNFGVANAIFAFRHTDHREL